MMLPSTISEIERLIRDQIQENIHLDYKASKAVSQKARDEIAKDVSAFANSDGGVLIYGVEEDKNTHLPVRIDDGVEDSVCSREWIENIITSGISPKINDVRMLPLPVSPGRSLYVISVARVSVGHIRHPTRSSTSGTISSLNRWKSTRSMMSGIAGNGFRRW